VVEGGGLENRCGATHRGFESLSLRHIQRRGARVAESGSLLRSCTRKGTVGSNPTLSAFFTVPIAQMDRALDCGSKGRRFESSWAQILTERCESG
jgi:hypothetical protein